MHMEWIESQHIVLSIDELFNWQDKLSALEDDKEKAFDLFWEFLDEAEDHLEIKSKYDGYERDYLELEILEDLACEMSKRSIDNYK